MGISRLLPFLEKRGVLPRRYAIGDFAHCAVAVDGHGYLYTAHAAALSQQVKQVDILQEDPDPAQVRATMYAIIARFLLRWLHFGVTPVLIFDGEAPPEKKETKEKRVAEKNVRRERLECLRRRAFAATERDLKTARSLAAGLSYLSSKEVQLAVEFVAALGVRCLWAKGEGEALCALGAREGKFAAVFSKDTDNLAYGCPLLLVGFGRPLDRGAPTVVGYRLAEILRKLGLSFPAFVDLCIMSGCDYNKNIPRVGVAKSYSLLSRCGRIEDLPAELNTGCLNFERCRALFAYRSARRLIARKGPETGSPRAKERPGKQEEGAAPRRSGAELRDLEGLFPGGPARKEGRGGNALQMLAVDPLRFDRSGRETLKLYGLEGEFGEDLEREISALPRPSKLQARHPK